MLLFAVTALVVAVTQVGVRVVIGVVVRVVVSMTGDQDRDPPAASILLMIVLLLLLLLLLLRDSFAINPETFNSQKNGCVVFTSRLFVLR